MKCAPQAETPYTMPASAAIRQIYMVAGAEMKRLHDNAAFFRLVCIILPIDYLRVMRRG